MANLNPLRDLIMVKHNGKLECLLAEEVYYIKGAGKTVTFFTSDPIGGVKAFRTLVTSANLGRYEYLEKLGFVRVHQSFMVNKRHMLRVGSDKVISLRCPWEHELICFSKRLFNRFCKIANRTA